MIHLTGQSFSAREIIQNIFSPLVGVVSSPLANDVCFRNNLSFVELLQPFAKLPSDAHFRDVTGTSVSIRGLRLNICDVDWRPPQTMLARKMLNEAVTNANNEKTKIITIGKDDLELPTAEPWFENWRETFMTVQFPADHEFTRHFLSCLIVLTSGDPNIVDTAHKLTQRVQQMQNVTPQKLPKWFHPTDVLNSYVVLHEGSQGDLSKAQQGYEMLKSTFGDSKCFLILINSLDGAVTSEIPDYWKPYIKRLPKNETQMETISAPKTPQDGVSVISMPTMQTSGFSETSSTANENDLPILHPLSPVQENATEAINSKFSISCESIVSQTINPNVWATDIEADAPLGACLNAMDVENLRHFVQDYTIRALIPYAEQLVAILNEAITNKKGVSKSLLSATKRWFVTSKPTASATNQNAVIYTQESSELQTRKLGDLYFMFGHYNLAFQAYHQAKRDFNADQAWQYYAGALEMAAVSAFMLGTANRKTYDYMEDAIVCYLTVCKLQQFATRATLLSIECLKTARLYGEAAKQLIRMTSEESDLRSALLLEQAAYCYLASQPSMHRKYAFHIVLSGNRYSRAGQRKHSYRCYRQAYQVFKSRGWSLAEDHIQYTLAKQAYTLKKLEESSFSYAHLLRPGSLQGAQQQASFLKEYIQTQNELLKRSPALGLLPHALPHVVQDSIRVLLSIQRPITNPLYVPANNIDIKDDLSNDHIWHKLEEMIVITAAANKPVVFKPSRSLFTKSSPTTEPPLAVQGEPIELAVTLLNSIKCSITMTNIDLLWKLKLDNEEELSNTTLYEQSDESSNTAVVCAAIKTNCIESLVLEEHAEKTLYFSLTPKLTGYLNIIGIIGHMAATAEPNITLRGTLHFETQRIRPSGKQPLTQTLFDSKLSVRIMPTVPTLGVSFSQVPKDLLAGEIVPVTVSLRNYGINAIDEIFMGCDNPRWITLLDKDAEVPVSLLSSIKDISNEKLVKDKEIRRQRVFRLLKNKTDAALKAQDGTTISMWIQAPYEKGEFTLRLLFYYAITGSSLKYRLIRHTWKFNIHECLQCEMTCIISNHVCNELGLDINIKNENEMHHTLLAELYLNSLAFYCPVLQLNNHKFYQINQMEITKGQLGDRCLKSSKCASFQCRLEKSDHEPVKNDVITEFLRSQLSKIDIMPMYEVKEQQLPALAEIFSFLVKHETVFFSTSISGEEFNNSVANFKPHATVVLNWCAVVVQNSTQRVAMGQHFVQLHKLYECVSCPTKILHSYKMHNQTEADDEEDCNLCNFAPKVGIVSDYTDALDSDEDHWEPNDNIVTQACLLADDGCILTANS